MTNGQSRWVLLTFACGALLTIAGAADAQSNDEVFPQFQWNFSTPGARANALGRAFIGLADDASASITNPAGLIRLTRPQVSVEFKNTSLDVSRLAARDSLTTLAPTVFSSTTNSISFFSISKPIGDKLAVAFTRHEFLNYKETFSLDSRPIPNHPQGFYFFPVEGSSDFKGVDYAGSAAFAVSDQLKVGASLTFNQLSATSDATRFGFKQNSVDKNPADIQNETIIDASKSAIGATVGVIFLPNDKVSVGIQFTKGPHFKVGEDVVNGAGASFSGFPVTVHINVPNRIGFGVGTRPSSRLLVAFDVLRIGYSSLAKDFTAIFDSPPLTGEEYAIKDVTEVHAGGEYLLMTGSGRSVFVRAGVFSSPDHSTRFLGTSDAGLNAVWNATYNLLPRKTDMVGTVGAGITLGAKMQVDLAYVWSREFVFSLGVRF